LVTETLSDELLYTYLLIKIEYLAVPEEELEAKLDIQEQVLDDEYAAYLSNSIYFNNDNMRLKITKIVLSD